MPLHAVRCAECSAPFSASRVDAELCSGRCRERRRKSRAARDVERASALLALQAAAIDHLTGRAPDHRQEIPTP